MDSTDSIDHQQLPRTLRYWRLRLLRRIPFTNPMIYNQAVGSLNTEHQQIPPLYIGDIERGELIEEDRFPLGEEGTLGLLDFWSSLHKKNPETKMRRSGLSINAIYWLNRFDWLADLEVYSVDRNKKDNNAKKNNDTNELDFRDKDSDQITKLCVNTLQNWMTAHPHWTPLAWHVPTLARRINNWLYFYQKFFGSSINTSFDSLFFASISKQLDHLRTCVLHETQGFERILSLICWVNTGLCISSEEKHSLAGQNLLAIELGKLIKKPHQELLAAPQLVYELHHMLRHLSHGFLRQKISVPPKVRDAIKFLEALLQDYRTPNNTLPRFHGATDLAAKSIQFPNKNKNLKPLANPALRKMRHESFEVLIDTSSCTKDHKGNYKHISPMAIEIYDGRSPLVINLSAPAHDTFLDLQEYRESAFHSMPSLETPELGTIRADGRLNARYQVRTEILEQNGGEVQSIICRHDGYMKSVGGVLERRIDLWHDPKHGPVIQGRDTLEFSAEPKTDDSLRLISVFHLPPEFNTTAQQGGGVIVHQKKPALAWQFSPIGTNCLINAIENFSHYEHGQQPKKVKTLWMSCDIAQAENLTSYSNEWTIVRANK